jgi:hypothetical protein
MADDRRARQDEEPQRVLGIPVRSLGPRPRQDTEPQRVMGFPVGSLGPRPAGREQLLALAHPFRAYRRWLRRRRLGPYAAGEDEP